MAVGALDLADEVVVVLDGVLVERADVDVVAYAQCYTDDEYAVNPESYLMGISRANAVELFFTAMALLVCAVGGVIGGVVNGRRG